MQELRNWELVFPPEVSYRPGQQAPVLLQPPTPSTRHTIHSKHSLAQTCSLLPGKGKGQDLRRAPKQELSYLLLNTSHV